MAGHSEKFYKTLPPIQISEAKVQSAIDFLIFSGTRLYLEQRLESGHLRKFKQSITAFDSNETEIQLELTDELRALDQDSAIIVSFGYKRKRASFETKLLRIESDACIVAKPTNISLNNLRRNPRAILDLDATSGELEGHLLVQTSVGEVEIRNIEAYEVSQLGMSLFVERSDQILLAGDTVKHFDFKIKGQSIFRGAGVIGRVDYHRKSENLKNSYQIIVLFKNQKPITERGSEKFRSAKRYPVIDDKPCYFTAEHPFFPGRKIAGQVFEISSSGMSCILEKSSFPVVAGMRFDNCQLQLPFCPQRDLSFEVVHVDFRSDGENIQFKIGGEFQAAPVDLIKDISSYTQSISNPSITDVSEEDLDLLWEFMFETNFIYQSKRRQIQNQSKEILETYSKLISKPNPIVKKLILKEEGEIKGHVAAIRFYDNAWIIQHLSALKSSSASAAQSVVSSIVDFFYDSKAHQANETFYVLSYFRPDNIYPAILFGESCRLINDPSKSTTTDFLFGIYDPADNHMNPQVQVSVNQTEDILELIQILSQKGQQALIRTFGLGHSNFPQMKLASAYESLGLYRNRCLYKASDGIQSVYALVENSSPGVNLSELTNSIFLVSNMEAGEAQNTETLTNCVLAQAFKEHFDQRGMCPVVLAFPDYPAVSSIRWSKIYRCWITSAEAVPDFERASHEIIKDFRNILKAMRAQQEKIDPSSKILSLGSN